MRTWMGPGPGREPGRSKVSKPPKKTVEERALRVPPDRYATWLFSPVILLIPELRRRLGRRHSRQSITTTPQAGFQSPSGCLLGDDESRVNICIQLTRWQRVTNHSPPTIRNSFAPVSGWPTVERRCNPVPPCQLTVSFHRIREET